MTIPRHSQSDEPLGGHALPLLYNLVYCSRAAAGVDSATLDHIIATARRRNPALGITGLLVFGGGVFFQWLEGPRDNVTQLMATIASDPRHASIVRLSANEEVRERLFPSWDMELVQPTDIREVLQDALDTSDDASTTASLGLLLEQLDSGALDLVGTA